MVAAGLGVCAVVLLVCAPVVLTAGGWQIRRPGLALGLWLTACGAGVLLVVGAALLAAFQAATLAPEAGYAGVPVTIAAWLVLTALGGLVAYVAASAEPLKVSHDRSRGALAPVATSREDCGAFDLVRFSSPTPRAHAVPGRRAEVWVSSALEEMLTLAQLRAVLAHELAHLRYRHGAAMRIADLNAACLPRWLSAGRAMRRSTRLAIELVADDYAARVAGGAHLATALDRLSDRTDDPSLALRAARLTTRRTRRTRLPEHLRVGSLVGV